MPRPDVLVPLPLLPQLGSKWLNSGLDRPLWQSYMSFQNEHNET
jgi:hypothetical protein